MNRGAKRIATYVVVLLHCVHLFSQPTHPLVHIPFIKLPNADAANAIEIQDTVAGPFNVSLGHGQITSTLEGGNNTAWFKFTIVRDTLLTFDIVPTDSMDDYDFALFKCTDTNCIDANGRGNFKEVRNCLSQSHLHSGMTGLSTYAAGAAIAPGPGPSYVAALPVKKGEVYYLMVIYGAEYLKVRHAPLGFKIYFYNNNPEQTPIVLNDIFFETGNAVLKKESFPELNHLSNLLRKSKMVIEIRGYTDNTGNEQANQKLSEERAKAVADYLISKKIDTRRIFYKGYGSAHPVASNVTAEGREKNRRVEFVKMIY